MADPRRENEEQADHLIPLSRLALETVKTALKLSGDDTEFLFPARYNNGKPLDGHALTTAMARFCADWKEPPSLTICAARSTPGSPCWAWRRKSETDA